MERFTKVDFIAVLEKNPKQTREILNNLKDYTFV